MPDDRITVRSFRVVFDLERRIHKIDRYRIPLPYGLPIRSIGYFAAAVAALSMLARLPLVGGPLQALPAPLRFAIVPGLLAYALTETRIDGRPAHRALPDQLRFLCTPKAFALCRPAPCEGTYRLGPVCVALDERSPCWARGRLRGPATVVFRYPIDARQRRRRLEVTQADTEPSARGRCAVIEPNGLLLLR